MKKFWGIFMGMALALSLYGCGVEEPAETTVEETYVEEVTAVEVVEEPVTVYVSEEYLQELGYNSRENVYFGG